MPNFTELRLSDGTPVRFEVRSGEGAAPHAARPESPRESAGFAASADSPEAGGSAASDEFAEFIDELPDGMGEAVPVGRGAQAAAYAVDTLRATLRPLGWLLQEVHDAVVSSPNPPHEVNVTFGVQVGHDLKLGIVGGSGEAHLTVSATWQPPTAAG